MLGHSGLRAEATAVNPMTWLVRMFDMELVIEDHDLHYRNGWRRSHNYGKQTRLWDRLFGTTFPVLRVTKGRLNMSTQPNPFVVIGPSIFSFPYIILYSYTPMK